MKWYIKIAINILDAHLFTDKSCQLTVLVETLFEHLKKVILFAISKEKDSKEKEIAENDFQDLPLGLNIFILVHLDRYCQKVKLINQNKTYMQLELKKILIPCLLTAAKNYCDQSIFNSDWLCIDINNLPNPSEKLDNCCKVIDELFSLEKNYIENLEFDFEVTSQNFSDVLNAYGEQDEINAFLDDFKNDPSPKCDDFIKNNRSTIQHRPF